MTDNTDDTTEEDEEENTVTGEMREEEVKKRCRINSHEGKIRRFWGRE